MDSLQYLLAEALRAQREQELQSLARAANVSKEPRTGRGLRHTLASSFVRVGLRLDPAAGEGLPAFDVTLTGHGSGC